MTPKNTGHARAPARRESPAPELIAASLLTSDQGSEIHLMSRDGRLLRLTADAETARSAIIGLWKALDSRR
ncbi:hypothetical protein [Falsiroseomonas ponticola]|jgi:hypothetical protein|uniref:hypothetical protein n=1 Tax=Falsiroseomonas ponticola TaxID=2786951 RepID=UPI0019318F2D|nr:hypothetical protein [Roseomonas ponticola]